MKSTRSLHFLLGVAVGLSVSFIMWSSQQLYPWHEEHAIRNLFHTVDTQMAWSRRKSNSEGFKAPADVRPVHFDDDRSHDDNDAVARNLAKTHPVLCWIMTSPKTLLTKAVHVRNTWARRCNKFLFMSSESNSTFPAVGLNVSEGREHLTAKTMQAFYYIYDHHFNDADWFMKADDDTYVIVENLRYMLSSYDPNEPLYFGQEFIASNFKGHSYASGGAGYVVSKEALRRLATTGRNSQVCKQDGAVEDFEIGGCLKKLGATIRPTLDRLGRTRFHCFEIDYHLQGYYPDWYYSYDVSGAKWGMESISDYAISFHYVSGVKMYTMEFMIYHLRPYGIISQTQSLDPGRTNSSIFPRTTRTTGAE